MGFFDFIFEEERPKRESKVYVDDQGYFRFKDSDKLVHRWAAEKKLGRKLRQGEVVHHINRNKKDNSLENLMILSSQDEHNELHERDARNFGDEYSYSGGQKQITLYYLLVGWWNK